MSRDYPALLALLERRRARRFSWRSQDCVRFAAAAIKAQTGRDPLKGLPRWRSRREALALARAEGGLEAAVDKRLTRVAPARAQRGDIAGVPDPIFGVRLMVIEGATLVGPGALGLERQPRSAMVMAWSAGERGDG